MVSTKTIVESEFERFRVCRNPISLTKNPFHKRNDKLDRLLALKKNFDTLSESNPSEEVTIKEFKPIEITRAEATKEAYYDAIDDLSNDSIKNMLGLWRLSEIPYKKSRRELVDAYLEAYLSIIDTLDEKSLTEYKNFSFDIGRIRDEDERTKKLANANKCDEAIDHVIRELIQKFQKMTYFANRGFESLKKAFRLFLLNSFHRSSSLVGLKKEYDKLSTTSVSYRE